MTVLEELVSDYPGSQADLFPMTSTTAASPRRGAYRRAAVIATDAAATLVTALVMVLVTSNGHPWLGLDLSAAWLAASWAAGSYRRRTLKGALVDVKRHAGIAVLLWAGMALIGQLHPVPHARILTLIAVPGTALAVAIGRFVLQLLTRRMTSVAPSPVVVVGSAYAAREFAAGLRDRNSGPAVTVAAACLTDTASAGILDEREYSAENVRSAVTETGSDTVIVLDAMPAEQLRELSWALEPEGVAVATASLWRVAPHRISTRAVGRATAVIVEPQRYRGTRHAARNALDRVIAAAGLLLLSPLLLVIAIAIKVDNPGPVFYRHQRTGRAGKRFGVWKFRTMVKNADTMQKALADQYGYEVGPLFKVRNDPRITRLGGFLRRTSLDELPQLINVLCGEMALIGPRPVATLMEEMPKDYQRRLLVRPGITGLWQVNGRSDLHWDDAVRLDLHYVENHSLTMDVGILGRTVPAVVSSNGAY